MRFLLRALFSRYTISLFFIVLELALLVYLITAMSAYSWVFILLMLIVNAVVLVSVICADYNPESRVSWVVTVLILPVFGAVIYILFRSRGMSGRDKRLANAARRRILEQGGDCRVLDSLAGESRLASGKALSILNSDQTAELSRGRVKYYPSGDEMFREMLKEISSAERFIFLEYFIIEDGEMWREILEILKGKARAGVDVRVLYDDIGCMRTLPEDYYLTLLEWGIKAYRFSPVSPPLSAVHNNRDHRKICIVDGRVAFTGGINIADEYIGRKERFGVWKDGGVSVYGDAVQGFTRLFITIWDMTSQTESDCRALLATPHSENDEDDGGYYLPFGSGPSSLYREKVGKRAFVDIINQAERYVYITTPYLVIDYDLTEALIGAARRGVDVRIITPGVPDKPLVKVMTKSSYPRLIEGGVSIYEYTPGFMHLKLLISDDAYSVVGTINLDYRSFVHHFEDALWSYGSPATLDMRDDFMRTLEVCKRISPEDARLNIWERAVRALLSVIAPLL